MSAVTAHRVFSGRAFGLWMDQVDDLLRAECGLASDDLPEADYHDLFADGLTAREAVNVVLESFGMLDDE